MRAARARCSAARWAGPPGRCSIGVGALLAPGVACPLGLGAPLGPLGERRARAALRSVGLVPVPVRCRLTVPAAGLLAGAGWSAVRRIVAVADRSRRAQRGDRGCRRRRVCAAVRRLGPGRRSARTVVRPLLHRAGQVTCVAAGRQAGQHRRTGRRSHRRPGPEQRAAAPARRRRRGWARARRPAGAAGRGTRPARWPARSARPAAAGRRSAASTSATGCSPAWSSSGSGQPASRASRTWSGPDWSWPGWSATSTPLTMSHATP